MSESKLLQEAIADAKAVKQTALENAKIALEEAFTPKLQNMLSNKIQEELEEAKADIKETDDDDEDDKDKDYKDDDKDDMDEMKYDDDDYDEDDMKSKKSKKSMKENDDEDEDDDEDDYKDDDDMDENSDADLDLEAVIKELEEDLQETADIDQDPHDDDDANEEETITKKQKPVNKESKDADVELDLDAILEEIELEEDINVQDTDKDTSNNQIDELNETVSEQAVMLEDYKKAVIFLKEKINEINLLNAKLLYANKLFRTYEMTNEDKVKVIEAIDRSTSTREVKLVYSTLAESMRMANASNGRTKKINEGASVSQTSTKPTTEQQPKVDTTLITEAVDPARWKKLAGLD